MRLFETLEALARSEYVFRIQDNGGDSADRYTVVFSDGDYLALSYYPSSPVGVSLTGEGIDPQALSDWAEEGRAVDLALGDLPRHVQEHIWSRINEAWRDFLEAVEKRDPHAVARTRGKAKPNEGDTRCGGVGIYAAGSGFCVRLDSDDAGEDRGPYMSAADALAATLPDVHALAGDEYQSPQNVGRLTPCPETAARVAALESKVEAQDAADYAAREAALNARFA